MALFTPQRFTLTADHVKLIRRMCVGWDDIEYGAPQIDPKRPYGNSDVEQGIHEILTGRDEEIDDLSRVEREALEARYRQLHEETKTALQVVLAAGSFEPGEYMADEYSNNWQPAATFQGNWPD
jgi:hypothetical protein